MQPKYQQNSAGNKYSVCQLLLHVCVAATFVSCASTGSYTAYDSDQKVVKVQTSGDISSALPTLMSKSEVQSAINSLKTTIEAEPKNVKALLNLAELYVGAQNYKAAHAVVRKALRYDLRSQKAKKILAEIYLRTDNGDMATIILNGLGGDRSKDPDILNMLATVAMKEDRKSDALYLYQRGLDLDPDNVALRMNVGVLFVRYRQLARAAIQFERVLKVIPEHNDAKLHLAIIEAANGRYDRAEEVYNTILSRKSGNPTALYNLAVLETKRKNFDEAADLLKQYLNSSYARNANNDEIFALMEEIDSRRRRNTGLSDDEAMSIAEKMSSNGESRKSSVARQQNRKQPQQNQNESDTSMIDNDIKALESQLSQ